MQLISYLYLCTDKINTLMSGLIQAVRKKQLFRMWLCAGISPLLYGLQTWLKHQKTW